MPVSTISGEIMTTNPIQIQKEHRFNEIRSRKKVEIDDLNTTAHNKQLLKTFLYSYLKSQNLHPNTSTRYEYSLTKFLDFFDNKLDLDKATKDDIVKAMARMNSSNLAAETKRKIVVHVKVFYRYLLGEDEYYPKQVSWLKTSVKHDSKIMPADLFTMDELMRIIENGRSVRDKAILALLAEWGLRVSELTSMKVKSVQLNQSQITVSGKTGQGVPLPIIMSKPYLVMHMENMKYASPEEPLWQSEGTWKKKNVPITNAAVNKMLKQAAKDAGIKKNRVYVHLLRHSSATRNAPLYTTAIMNKLYRWSPTSNMHATYTHLNDNAVTEAVLRANGMALEQPQAQVLQKKCGACSKDNPNTFSYCQACGYNLNSPTTTLQKDVKNIRELIVEELKDPKLLEDVIHAYLSKNKKQQ